MRRSLHPLHELTRRQLMARTAQTLLGVGLLPQIFPSEAFAATQSRTSQEGAKAPAKNVIYLYMAGGQSHIDTWDPKRGESAGPTKPIQTSADGIEISEYLPRTAKHMHLGTIIRSMSSTQGAHAQGNYYMHTSYEVRPTIQHPSLGAWLSHFQGPGNPTLPASVYVGGESGHPSAGFLPAKDVPLFVNNPNNGLKNLEFQRGLTPEKHLERMKLAFSLDNEFHQKFRTSGVSAYREMYEAAYRMMKSADLVAFDLSQEPAEIRAAYGKDIFGQGCLLARRLVEHGVRFVEVGCPGWDTHVDNFNKIADPCRALDEGLSALLGDLQSRGLLRDTLVVVTSEFGRTPAISNTQGRGHHPAAFSSVLFGGGVRAGSVHGATDPTGSQVTSRKVTIPDFNATLAHALGLPLQQVTLSPSGRPFTVAHKGKPVTELFA